jgi:hypothetical protein
MAWCCCIPGSALKCFFAGNLSASISVNQRFTSPGFATFTPSEAEKEKHQRFFSLNPNADFKPLIFTNLR